MTLALALAGPAEAANYKNNFLGGAYLNYKLDMRLKKEEVRYETAEAAGSVVINTRKKNLYFVLGGGKAIRYGISVGREGFNWKGTERVSRKAEWPDWRPPIASMAPNSPGPSARPIRQAASACSIRM